MKAGECKLKSKHDNYIPTSYLVRQNNLIFFEMQAIQTFKEFLKGSNFVCA